MNQKPRTLGPAAPKRTSSAVRNDEVVDLRHRLTNNLQLVLALIAKESANAEEPKVKAVLERLAHRVQELKPGAGVGQESELGG